MINSIAFYCFYFVISGALIWLSDALESPFIKEFLTRSLITLLVALIAINTTARTALMAKIKELGDKNKVGFSDTVSSMKSALYEQVGLLAVAIFVSIFATSPLLEKYVVIQHILLAILGVSFIGSVQIIVDTGKAVLMLLDAQQN